MAQPLSFKVGEEQSSLANLRILSAEPAFTAGAGVTQGCHLSPTIFPSVTDLVGRAMRKALGSEDVVPGFADDLAAVMRYAWVTLPVLGRLFAAIAPAIGCRLNPHKCVWRCPSVAMAAGPSQAAGGICAGLARIPASGGGQVPLGSDRARRGGLGVGRSACEVS